MRKIVLLDGSEYYGKGFGSLKDCVAEIVVESSMSGYQKSIADERNSGKILLFTYPLIGNYGINNETVDYPQLKAIIVREYCEIPSNFRSAQNLEFYLNQHDIVGISEIDTRSLFRKIRNEKRQFALICDASVTKEEAIEKIKQYQEEKNLVSKYSCKKPVVFMGSGKKVVVVDYGYSKEIVSKLREKNLYVVVLPYNTSVEEILSYHPDGVILSDGIGNPYEIDCQEISKLFSKTVVLGINFGQLVLARSAKIQLNQLDYKCCSSNHPVKELVSGKVMITSKNCEYNIDLDALSHSEFEVTYLGVNEKNVEGIKHKDYPVYGIQFNPESNIFEEFVKVLKGE